MNKYLLERYPTIWNTHIVWVLPLALLAQVLFFIVGFCLINDDMLKDSYYSIYSSYEGIPLILNLIVSVLLLVGWLIYLFRNNALQHFYPLKARQLFGQFVCFFLTILLSISLAVPFFAGQKAKAHWRYTDSYIDEVLHYYPEDYQMYEYTDYYPQEQVEEYYIAQNAQRLKERDFKYCVYEPLQVFVILSFFMAMVLFCIRATGLRTFLFSVVFSGVLSLLVTMLAILFIPLTEFTSYYDEECAMGLFLLTYVVVLVLSLKLQGKIRKLFSGVLLNVSITFFGLAFFFLGYLLIKSAYHFIYLASISEDYYDYNTFNTLSDRLDFFTEPYHWGYYLLQWLFVLVVMAFTALYTKAVLRWKALPE